MRALSSEHQAVKHNAFSGPIIRMNVSHQLLVLQETARLLDSGGVPKSAFVCRASEAERIKDLICKNLKSKFADVTEASIILICGPPGTGKTCTVLHQLSCIANTPQLQLKFHSRWSSNDCLMNGAMMQDSKESIRSFVSKVLFRTTDQRKVFRAFRISGASAAIEAFGECMQEQSGHSAVVIDEADHLISLLPRQGGKNKLSELHSSSRMSRKTTAEHDTSSILLNFIEIASKYGAIIIMISNTLSTTLPRIKQRGSDLLLISESVIFGAYSDKELDQILEKRIELAKKNVLNTLDQHYQVQFRESIETFSPFAEGARSLALKRIATHQGDCRQMIETCRCLILQKIVDMEATIKRQQQYYDMKRSESTDSTQLGGTTTEEEDEENDDDDEILSTIESDHLILSDSPVISFQDTVNILDCQFQKSKSKCTKLLENLPLHQQILLCCICVVASNKSILPDNDEDMLDIHTKPETMSKSFTKSSQSFQQLIPVDVKTIQEAYKRLCTEHQISREYVNTTNFLEALNSLQTVGILELKSTPQGRRNAKSLKGRASRPIQQHTGAQIVEILLDAEDVCEVLKKSKRVFGTWLDDDDVLT